MVWIGRDLKYHLVPNPLPWAGTSSTRPGCSKPHPPGLEHFQGADMNKSRKGTITHTKLLHT